MGKSNLRSFDRLACGAVRYTEHRIRGNFGILRRDCGRYKQTEKERKPVSMRMKQAAAAVGQSSIIYLYGKFFGE